MPDKIYTQEYVVQDTEIDFTGRMTMQALMTLFQNAAGVHAGSFGMGFERLNEMGMAWVLAKSYIEIKKPPERGQQIRLITWPGATRRCYYPRYFILESMSGEQLCCCSSLWVIIHTESRDMFVDREGLLPLPDTSELKAPAELPKKLKLPETAAQTVIRSPEYSEIDINRHLNNTKYLAWICDMVGCEHFETHSVRSAYIVYSSEILPRDTVTLSRWQEQDADIFHGVNQSGTSCFQARLCWRQEESK